MILSRAGERGVVFVEFLFAFFPVFLLFLGVCQLAGAALAQFVVQHAALTGARSAIVVLDEPPSEYDGSPRGSLSLGAPSDEHGLPALLQALNLGSVSHAPRTTGAQRGARMAPIRTAAYVPLLALTSMSVMSRAESLRANQGLALLHDVERAVRFTRASAAVSVHAGPGAHAAAPEPLGPSTPVTVRIGYLFHCGVPLVSSLLCHRLDSLSATTTEAGVSIAARMSAAESFEELETYVGKQARFLFLSAEATLPNQGARYEPEEDEDER